MGPELRAGLLRCVSKQLVHTLVALSWICWHAGVQDLTLPTQSSEYLDQHQGAKCDPAYWLGHQPFTEKAPSTEIACPVM